MKNDKNKHDEEIEEITERAEREDEKEDAKEKKLQKRIEELEQQVKRTLADYQNLEKRTQEQRREWMLSANKELLLRLLPILDTLILAQKHSKDATLDVTTKQFLGVLKQEGVEQIETIGKDFDPHTMECIETIKGEDGKVLEEVQAGFRQYDKILRVALVKVGNGKE